MSKFESISLPSISIRYPTQTVTLTDTSQTIDYDLKRTQGVMKYLFALQTGSLAGGTSPAWTVSESAPLITHIKITADNSVLYDADTGLIQEMSKLLINDSPDGQHFYVEMVDRDYKSGNEFISTVFPSYQYNQVILSVTFNALGNVSSGGGSSGIITMNYSETDIERNVLQNAKVSLATVKKLQISTSLSLTGDNDLTSFLSQTGSYKSILYFVSGSQVSSGSYIDGSDTAINYIELIINDLTAIRSDFWSLMKNTDHALFKVTPDAGFVLQVFQDDDEIGKLLNLSNVNSVKSVDVRMNTSESPVYVYAMKILYA